VEQQVMVYIVFRIERSQGQPGELRRKRADFHRVPQRTRPLNVVVAVEIAAADCRG